MFIIIEGLDRTGKSTVAEHYKSEGYEVVHMSAPDKKYKDPSYQGPTYFEELYEMYSKYNGIDVVFDRTPYGEMVWPHVYGRDPMLTEEDIMELREMEQLNDPKYLFMTDPDVKAHWDRCEANKEPLKKEQFKTAISLYRQLATRFRFQQVELPVFLEKHGKSIDDATKSKHSDTTENASESTHETQPMAGKSGSLSLNEVSTSSDKSPEQLRLDEANAINAILTSRIVKKKGTAFDKLDRDIKVFLNKKLGVLFGKQSSNFTSKEVQILKTYCDLIEKRNKG